MTLKQGSLLQNGKYKILQTLGQGGFGITYLAEHTLLESNVAIKEFFFKEYCERDAETSHVRLGTQSNKDVVEKFRRKFLKEAQIISKLHHPNIIQISDFFRENNTGYYVMEYIDGESLADMIKRRGPLPEEEAFDYIRQTAEALDYIHKSYINHLDIKPGNIMVRRKNQRAVLIDFGVSKRYNPDSGEGSTIVSSSISRGYSPLEQYDKMGVSTFSPQADIYALGATLFKLLTGETPPEPTELIQKSIDTYLDSVSPAAHQLISASMQLRKQDRLQDAAAFLRLLKESQMESEPIKPILIAPLPSSDPKSVPVPPLPEKKKRKHIFAASVFAIVTLIAVSMTAIYWPSKPKHNPQEQKHPVKPTGGILPTVSFEKALLLLSTKKTAMNGIAMLDTLSAQGNADATYLLSRIYFVSNLKQDNIAIEDTIKQYKQNIPLDYIEKHSAEAHSLLETCIAQDSTHFQALFQLGLDYIGGSARQNGIVRDISKAKNILLQSKVYAEKAGNKAFARKVQDVLNNY